jgi:hypothetical protein
MPKLKLCGDVLDPFWVRAVTVFPKDLAAAQSCYAVECVKAKMADEPEGGKHVVDTHTLRLLLEAPSYATLKKTVAANSKRAIVAGDILGALYLMHKFDIPEPSFNKAVYVAMQYAKTTKYGDGTPLAISEPTIRACWEEYKTVAHFWAAFRLGQAYPFANDVLQRFDIYLQVAQGLFAFGTAFIPKRARPQQTILSREDCWTLPAAIEAKHLVSERVPDALLKYLKKYKAPKSRF